jgi:nitrite reductase/ring-hydroxylating ferredoxin subunit
VMCSEDELEPGDIRALDVAGKPVVLLRTGEGRYHALRNMCAHQGASFEAGRLIDEVRSNHPGEFALASRKSVLRCPWHGYEYAVDTGRCLADPENVRIRAYPVSVEAGQVIVEF